MNKRIIRCFADSTGAIKAQNIIYNFVGNNAMLYPCISAISLRKLSGDFTWSSFNGRTQIESRTTINQLGTRITTAFSGIAPHDTCLEIYIDNANNADNESVTTSLSPATNRIELFNENGVFITDNGLPFGDGTYPDYSPYYQTWVENRWKDKPTLSLDTTNTNHNEVSLKGSATYGNEASGFLLFGVSGDTEEFIELVEGATAFEFTTLEEMDVGDYSFRIYPFKGDPDSAEEPELGTPSDLLTVTVSDTDPTVVKT